MQLFYPHFIVIISTNQFHNHISTVSLFLMYIPACFHISMSL